MRITKKGKSAYNLRICPSFWPVWCRLTSSKSCKKVVVACLFHFILCPPFPSSTAYCVLLIQGFHCGDWARQFYVSHYIPPKPVATAFFHLRGVMYLYITYYISIRIWCQYWCQWCQTLSRHQIFQKCSARSVLSIPFVLPHRFP